MSFFHASTQVSLAGKTLVVPIVSTANVAQLAVDLLISSLGLSRVGAFDPRDLVPVVGGREDGEEGITGPLELFGGDGLDVLIIQQRSPALKSRKIEFIESLTIFIQQSHFGAVLFLSGVDLSNRTDAQMMTPTYQLIPPNLPSLNSTPLAALSNLPIPPYTSPVSQHPHLPTPSESDIPFIPGGGLTRRILSSLPSPWPIPVAALLQFVIEGDNRSDASLFALVVSKVLGIEALIGEWRQPDSWRAGLFGSPPDQTLYG